MASGLLHARKRKAFIVYVITLSRGWMSTLSYLARTPLPRTRKRTDKSTPPKDRLGYAISKKSILETLQTNGEGILKEMANRLEKEVKPSLEVLGDRFEIGIPWSETLGKMSKMDIEDHLAKALAALESLQTARFLLNTPETVPSISQEELARIQLTEGKDGPVIRIMSGLILPPRVRPPGDIYVGYIIDHFGGNMDLFEEMEALVPEAGYRALIPPARLGSRLPEDFFPAPRRCLRSLEEFRDSVKKYLVFDRGFREKTTYSVQIEIFKVTLDLELWLAWEPKRVEIRKHMDQGTSLPPRKVIELLERDEELEVVAVRIPRWLKNELEYQAKERNEQLGTHLRKRLEDIYT